MLAFTAVTLASTISPTGTPLRRIAKRVGKPTGALASKALSQVVKKERMTSVTAKPTTTSAPMMIHSIKFMISVGYSLLFCKKKGLGRFHCIRQFISA